MEQIKWVCVNDKFGSNGEPMIATDSIRWRKKDSISWFIDGTNDSWRHWRDKIGWRCVKIKVKIEILES